MEEAPAGYVQLISFIIFQPFMVTAFLVSSFNGYTLFLHKTDKHIQGFVKRYMKEMEAATNFVSVFFLQTLTAVLTCCSGRTGHSVLRGLRRFLCQGPGHRDRCAREYPSWP